MSSDFSQISSESILVIRTGALGDTILTLHLLESIKIAHPENTIVFLGNRAYKDLIPREIIFFAVDGLGWSGLFSATQQPSLPIPAFKKAYVILNNPDRVIENLNLTGTHEIRHATSFPPDGQHWVEHVHRSLGLPVPARRPILKHLAGKKILQPTIWMHPGSGGIKKCVPLRDMMDISKKLALKTGFELVITISEQDEFLESTPGWGEFAGEPGVSLVKNRSLLEVVQLLGSSALFIGNDSGISHLAANLGIPSMVFFVTSDPVQWSPWVEEKRLKIVDLRSRCMGGNLLIDGEIALALELLLED